MSGACCYMLLGGSTSPHYITPGCTVHKKKQHESTICTCKTLSWESSGLSDVLQLWLEKHLNRSKRSNFFHSSQHRKQYDKHTQFRLFICSHEKILFLKCSALFWVQIQRQSRKLLKQDQDNQVSKHLPSLEEVPPHPLLACWLPEGGERCRLLCDF